MSTAEEIKALQTEFKDLHERSVELSDQLFRKSASDIAKDASLRLAKKELDRLYEKVSAIQLQIEKLEIIQQIEEKMKMAQAFMPIGKFAINGFKGEVGAIIIELMSALIDVRESVDDQLARLSQVTAHSRYRQFEHYKIEGFSDDQAFMLTLASVHPINWSQMAQKASQSAASASRSKRG